MIIALDPFIFNAPEKNLDPPLEVEHCMCAGCDGTGTSGSGTAKCMYCEGRGELPVEMCESISESEGFHAEQCCRCNVWLKCGISPIAYGICESCWSGAKNE